MGMSGPARPTTTHTKAAAPASGSNGEQTNNYTSVGTPCQETLWTRWTVPGARKGKKTSTVHVGKIVSGGNGPLLVRRKNRGRQRPPIALNGLPPPLERRKEYRRKLVCLCRWVSASAPLTRKVYGGFGRRPNAERLVLAGTKRGLFEHGSRGPTNAGPASENRTFRPDGTYNKRDFKVSARRKTASILARRQAQYRLTFSPDAGTLSVLEQALTTDGGRPSRERVTPLNLRQPGDCVGCCPG